MNVAATLPDPPLLVITDRHQLEGDLLHFAAEVFRGGCRWLSLREKDLAPDARLALLRELVALGRGWDAVVTVHADIDAALAAGAAGVHLPAGGSLAKARTILGPDAFLGISTHSAEEVRAAGPADYATLSPIFDSRSKPGYGPGSELEAGLAGLQKLASLAPCPLVALGGVSRENAESCLRSGAAGLAVMGEVMGAKDPARAVDGLLGVMASARRRDDTVTA